METVIRQKTLTINVVVVEGELCRERNMNSTACGELILSKITTCLGTNCRCHVPRCRVATSPRCNVAT
jgi:hypothetical protein